MNNQSIKIKSLRRLWQGRSLSVNAITYTDIDGTTHTREFISPHGTKNDPRPVKLDTFGQRQSAVMALAFTPGRKRLLITKRFRPAAGKYVYDLPGCYFPYQFTQAEAAELELWRQADNVDTSMLRVMPSGYIDPDTSDARSGFVLFEIPENIKLKTHEVDHEKIKPMLVTPEELQKIIEEKPATMILHALAMTWSP